MNSAATILLFHTSNHAIRAEKLLKRADLTCRLMPVPRDLSSDCGVCLQILRANRERSLEILAVGGVTIAAVHDETPRSRS